jgi:ribosome biogenesis GTPase A
MDVETLAQHLLTDLNKLCPNFLSERYKKIEPETPNEALLEAVATSRGFVVRGGGYDTLRAARIVLDEYRGGRIARVTLESPDFLIGAEHG